jgi:hypothetical protein
MIEHTEPGKTKPKQGKPPRFSTNGRLGNIAQGEGGATAKDHSESVARTPIRAPQVT